MTKHPYQTCLRMPLTLKEDMTTICDRYQINESDLMRRAIVELVTNIQRNPDQTSRHMFVWGHTRTSLGYDTRQDLSDTTLRGLLRWGQEGSEEGIWVFYRLRSNGSGSPLEGLRYGDTVVTYPSQTYSATLSAWKTWLSPSAWRLPCFLEVRGWVGVLISINQLF